MSAAILTQEEMGQIYQDNSYSCNPHTRALQLQVERLRRQRRIMASELRAYIVSGREMQAAYDFDMSVLQARLDAEKGKAQEAREIFARMRRRDLHDRNSNIARAQNAEMRAATAERILFGTAKGVSMFARVWAFITRKAV